MSDTITMKETPRSRRWVLGPRNQVRLEYLLEGTADDLTLCQHVRDNAPLFYGGCLRTEINLDPETVDEVNDQGRWTATVQYEELVGVIGFEGGESTAHVTQSIQTVHKYAPAGQTAPDFKGAIGVNGTDVDGVDVPAPTWDFQLSVIRTRPDCPGKRPSWGNRGAGPTLGAPDRRGPSRPGPSDPRGALAGFEHAPANPTCRPTVSRCTPNSWAMRRFDQPNLCNDKIV